jgi:hypothetical protein
VIGGDEAEPFLAAEPLHCSGFFCHKAPQVSACERTAIR